MLLSCEYLRGREQGHRPTTSGTTNGRQVGTHYSSSSSANALCAIQVPEKIDFRLLQCQAQHNDLRAASVHAYTKKYELRVLEVKALTVIVRASVE